MSCALEVDVWFEFVYSEANIADWPSRGSLGFAAELGVVPEVARAPPCDSWGTVEGAIDSVRCAELESRPCKRQRRR